MIGSVGNPFLTLSHTAGLLLSPWCPGITQMHGGARNGFKPPWVVMVGRFILSLWLSLVFWRCNVRSRVAAVVLCWDGCSSRAPREEKLCWKSTFIYVWRCSTQSLEVLCFLSGAALITFKIQNSYSSLLFCERAVGLKLVTLQAVGIGKSSGGFYSFCLCAWEPLPTVLEQQWVLPYKRGDCHEFPVEQESGNWENNLKQKSKEHWAIQIRFFFLTFHCKAGVSAKKAKELSVTACAAHPVLHGRNKEYNSCLF